MQNRDGRKALRFGLAAAAWLGVLFFFSGQTGTDSGELSGRVTRMLFGWLVDRGVEFEWLHHLVRKGAHFAIFAVEGFLTGMALLHAMRMRWAAMLTVAGCGAIAVLNELHQMTAEGRACNAADMAIDTCGAAAGLLLAVAVLHAFSATKRKATKYNMTGD